MIPGAFDYHRPADLGAAVQLLATLGDEALIVAGGHSLIPMMKLRLALPEHLVDLQDIASLRGITIIDGNVNIGAMATQAQLIACAPLSAACPILREAALQISDPQIRNLGTIGGNVVNGDPGNDMPAVMQVLDARYHLQGPAGTREVAAREFYHGIYDTARADGEILTAISFAVPVDRHGAAYEKQKRKIGDYATAAAAVLLSMDGDTCALAAIALTNVADTPLYAAAAGAALAGSRLAGSDLDSAVAAAESITSPASDGRGPAAFRTKVAGVMVRRAIARAGQREGVELMTKMHIEMTINGRACEALSEPRTLLIHFLREHQNLIGAHIGCDTGHCGACTVDLNGKSVKSCMVFVAQANGSEVTTIEGIAAADGSLHALQEAFREHHGLQCGFCTPGMITRAYRLLQDNPAPSDEEIRYGISGNLCRCTGYQNIVKSIRAAADTLNASTEAAQ